MLLEDKSVIVTGAAGGIGEGIARVCHREGARVVIADVRSDAARAVASSLGEKALAVTCDVSRPAQLEELVARSLDHFGRIDGLVNNAGINFVKPFLETTLEEWDRVLAVDLRGVFALTQLICRAMLRQSPPGGSIVNISSVHSLAAVPGSAPYDAAKCGIVGLTRCAAVELATQNIRLNVVSPGLVNTDIWRALLESAPDRRACEEYWMSNIPIQRVIETSEVGELVAFLLSDRASAITGANVVVDGGVSSQLISRQPYASRPVAGDLPPQARPKGETPVPR